MNLPQVNPRGYPTRQMGYAHRRRRTVTNKRFSENSRSRGLGVLFLDELAEFEKKTLEILRQPLEEHCVTVSRVNSSFTFPAHFMLVAALNPCPCGYYPDRSRCSCSPQQVRRYLGRISRPLLDRIDICAEAAPVTYRDIRTEQNNESSADMRDRIVRARQIQKLRYEGSGIYTNSEMGIRQIRRFCSLRDEDEAFL